LEWVVDLDFTAGDFFKMTRDEAGGFNDIDVIVQTGELKQSYDKLVGEPDFFQMHRGFVRAARALRPGVVTLLHRYYDRYPDVQNMFMTGHSLGAGLVQTMALMIPRLPVRGADKSLWHGKSPVTSYRNPHCYMFSSPAVGDQRFENFFLENTGETAQVYFDGDIVTAVPPFLVPPQDVTAQGYKKALESISILSRSRPTMAGVLWGLHLGFEHLKLPSFFDISNLYKRFEEFDAGKLGKLALEVAEANNKYRALRGGGVFFRLDPRSDDFIEVPYDPGNSATMWEWLAKIGRGDFEYFKEMHSLKKIVDRLAIFAANNPSVFDMDVKGEPAWAHRGGTSQKPAQGHSARPINPPPTVAVPDNIIQQLQDPRAHVIGYAHTKHYHKPFTLVPRNDVDRQATVYMPSRRFRDIQRRYDNSVKRHRTNKMDPTYHSHDYF
jgi:hypothetical protein